MKKLMLLFVLCATPFIGYVQTTTGDYVNMSPTQFKSALDAEKNERLLDVRQDWEFKKGRIENAENVDVMGDGFESKVSAIPRETPIYVYCYSGGRSAEAAEKLKEMGFKKVVNLTGGYAAWEKALLPVVK